MEENKITIKNSLYSLRLSGEIDFCYLLIILCVFVVILNFIFVSKIEAHHVRGLPHYAYSENYQQVPMIEETRISGGKEIIFSYDQVFKSKNYELAVYIRDKDTNVPYNGTVKFIVFGSNESPDAAHGADVSNPQVHTYKAGWTYEDDGLYTVRISFEDNGKKYVEDFTLQAGDLKFNYLWVIIPSMVVIFLIGLVLYNRSNEKKKVRGFQSDLRKNKGLKL